MEHVLDESLWSSLLSDYGYDLLGQIGSGSFSDVFAVRSKSSGSVLAVKRLVARRSIMSDPAVTAEISCLSKLSVRGACIIRLEETILLDRLACLVLELAPLGDLERHASKHWPLSDRLVNSVGRQVLSALAHCHRLHIAHRDVNPANVLLISAHSVRLADFGLAVSCRSDSSGRRLPCESYLGRESYLAPEVLKQSPYDAVQADMWSVGCLCAFLLTGKHPLPATAASTSPPTGCAGRLAVTLGGRPRPPLPGTPTCPTHACCSDKVLLAAAARCKRHRTGSCESEESCRSESDLEEVLALHSIPDSGGGGCGGGCGGGSESEPSFQQNSPRGFAACHSGSVEDLIPGTSEAVEADVFKETTAVDSALVHLMSRLCVPKPSERLNSEEALELWKQSLSKAVLLVSTRTSTE